MGGSRGLPPVVAIWRQALPCMVRDRLAVVEYGHSDEPSLPLGGEKNRAQSHRSGKGGVKRRLLTQGHKVPIAVVMEGAQHHEMKLVRSTI